MSFHPRIWIYWACALPLGGFAAFSLIMGPLFLFGLMKPQNGRSGTLPGIMLMLVGLGLAVVVVPIVFNIVARTRPTLKLCSEGLEINLWTCSSVAGEPQMPAFLLAVCSFALLRGVRPHTARLRWRHITQLEVWGPPAARELHLQAVAEDDAIQAQSAFVQTSMEFVIEQHEFEHSMNQIVETIQGYGRDRNAQMQLPSWD